MPISTVTKSWLTLPKIVNGIASKRFSCLTYKIRPPYSPTRFGVSMVMLQPASTLLKEFIKDSFSRGRRSSCHLKASIPQFKSIRKNANHNTGFSKLLFICLHLIARSGWWVTCLYKLQQRNKKIKGPRNQLNNILILLRRYKFW